MFIYRRAVLWNCLSQAVTELEAAGLSSCKKLYYRFMVAMCFVFVFCLCSCFCCMCIIIDILFVFWTAPLFNLLRELSVYNISYIH